MTNGKSGNAGATQPFGQRPPGATALGHLGTFVLSASLCLSAGTSAWAQGTVGVGTHMLPTGSGVNIGQSAGAKPAPQHPALTSALARLESSAGSSDDNPAAFEAISNQTRVPVKTLRQQRFATKLKYGDLLVANSLATRTGKSFDQILAQRAKSQSWAQVAGNLQIDPAWVVVRLTAADASLRKSKQRG